MVLGSLGFGLGVLLLWLLPTWPGWPLQAVLLGCLGVMGWCWRWWCWVLAGLGWSLVMAWPAHLQLPPALVGRDLQAQGCIVGLVQQGISQQWRIEVQSLYIPEGEPIPFQGQLQLRWYGHKSLPLHAGDCWRFTVRLRPPRGLLNPGGGDTERWYFSQGIHARGYVREYPAPERLPSSPTVAVWRETLHGRLQQRLAGDSYGGLVQALVVGDRQQLSAAQREILQRTGTAHLLAISGLHVGLVGGWSYLLALGLWRCVPGLSERLAAPRAAALAALPGSMVYALLAGFSLPTQRALLMLFLLMLAGYGMRPLQAFRLLAMALLVTLVLDPRAPLQAGFWLSFGAVATILYVLMGRDTMPEQLWWRIQWGISVVLFPLGVVLFQGVSLVGPLANLVAIPWASATVVPLSLLAALLDFSPVGDTLLALALGSIRWLMAFLSWLAQQPWAYSHWPAPPLWSLVLVLPGVLWLLAPPGVPGRWVGSVMCLPLLLPASSLNPGELQFTLLDVGDGLAAVVRTHEHVMVVDTGGRWRNGDAATSTLVPFLHQLGITKIDILVLSHDDSLHTGGYRSLGEAFAIEQVLTPAPSRVPLANAEACRQGQSWQWDGIPFQVLGPEETSQAGDDQSCVIQVADMLLLAGDIELQAQRQLARQGSTSVEVLVAPHHGRRDVLLSSWFVQLDPQLVLFSTAYANHHGYPRTSTCDVYGSTGAFLMSTADHGAISVHWSASGVRRLRSERQHRQRLWRSPATVTCAVR